MEKNSRTHTAHSDKKRCVHLASDLAQVNRFSLRRYTPRSRVSTAMAASERPEEQQRSHEHGDGGADELGLVQHHPGRFR